MSYEESGPDGRYREGITGRYGHVIRVRETAPGVWVPCEDGPPAIPADWLAAIIQDAHREVTRAVVRERERACTAHLNGALTRDDLRYLGIPDPGEFQPAPVMPRSVFPVPPPADRTAIRAALEVAKNRPPVVLPAGTAYTPRDPVLRAIWRSGADAGSCGVTGPAVSSGYGPEAVPPEPDAGELAALRAASGEKTLAAADYCCHCDGQLQGQVLAGADERGCFACCAASPDRKHEAGPAAGSEPERMDPADAIRASLYEPLMLDEAALDELAPYGKAGPGLCPSCWVGKITAGHYGGLCYYCNLSKRLAAGPAPELAMTRTATAQARAALKAPRAPACGRLDAVTWVRGSCGCPSAHAHEMARRRVSCNHAAVRDGHCTRCGDAVTPGDSLLASVTRFSRKARVVLTLTGSVFLWLGVHCSPVFYVLAALYLTMGLVLPGRTRRQR